MLAQSEIDKKIIDFLDHLEVEKGASPLTLRNYKHYLKRFSEWLTKEGIRKNLEDINPEVVRLFRLHISRLPDGKGGTLSRKTQGYHAIALRSYLKWLTKKDFKVMSPDKIDLPKIPERNIAFMSGEQVDRLLNSPSLSTINGKRDKAILEMLFSTGLRISELVSINRDTLDLERREFGITGKGGKTRVVFLSQRAVDWINKYIGSRADHFKPLFIRHKGKIDPASSDESVRLTCRSIQRMVKKYAQKVKIPIKVTPHIIRHSFASDLLIAGADIRSIQEMLGHKNIATTQIYTHVTNKQLKEIHEAFHGRGK